MDTASLLLYLRDRNRMVVSVVVVALVFASLILLGYAVFSGVLTTGHSPADQLLAPFRWWAEDELMA